MYSFFLNKILLPIGSLFFQGNYSKYLREWKLFDQMTEEKLEKIQAQRISALLQYAVKNVPYYQNLNIAENTKLKDFPILTKTLLRQHSDALISKDYKKENLEKNHSSGSSGVQSFTYMDYKHKFYLRALQTHWWNWGGYCPGEVLIQTGISPKRTLPKKLKDIFFRVLYLEAFSLNTKKIKHILNNTQHKTIKHLAGYPSALNEIAKVAIDEKKCYPFRSIISFGDKLFDNYIENFTKAFDNPIIINTYGCAEGILMASKIDIPYYYIMSPHVFLEIVDENENSLKDGERGHILVTCLTNFAMPLIRYKLGDLGVMLPKENYPKIRRFNYPLLQEVTGRETDVIKAPNGNVLIVHSFTGIIEFYEEIKQFKVVQTAKDKLLIEYITDSNTNIPVNIEFEIYNKITSLVKNSMEISFTRVKTIMPSPSGKPQIIEIRSFN